MIPMTRRQALFGLAATALTACGRREASAREVVLYSSLDERYAVELGRLFEAKGIAKVRIVSDTEATKSTGLVNRLVAERDRPIADVFLSGDPLRAAWLKSRGVIEPWWDWAGAGGLARQFGDRDGFWAPSSARLRLIVINQHRAENRARPKSVLDLARPEYATQSCIANPLFGTTTMHAAALFHLLGAGSAKAFFEEFARRGGRMLASNGEVRRRVSSGEFAYGLTDSDDVSVALRDKAHVDFVIPDQQEREMGVVVVPCAVCRVVRAPNPATGEALARFLSSADAERWLAQSEAAHLPLNEGVGPPALFREGLGSLRRATAPLAALASEMDRGMLAFLEAWVEGQTA